MRVTSSEYSPKVSPGSRSTACPSHTSVRRKSGRSVPVGCEMQEEQLGKLHACKTGTGPARLKEVVISYRNCNREEPNRTTCWICFFYFNLCFLLLLFIKRILSIHNGLPRGTLPLCLNVKPKCLRSGKHPDPVPPVDGYKKEEINTPPPRGWPFHVIFANLTAFSLYFLISSPSLCCKRNWHPNPNKTVFQRH